MRAISGDVMGPPALRLVVLLLLVALPARAADRVLDLPDADITLIAPRMEVCADRSRALGIEDLLAHPDACPFAPSSQRVPNLQFTKARAWARFTLRNGSDMPVRRVLALDLPHVLHVSLSDVRPDGSVHTREAGWLARTKSGEVQWAAVPAFPIVLPPHSERTYYLSADADGPLILDVKAYTAIAFARQDASLQVGYDMYIVLALLLGLYHLAAYFVTRTRAYLLLAPFAVSYALLYYLGSGVAHVHLGLALGPVIRCAYPLAGASLVFFGLLFARSLLSVPSTAPWLDRPLLVVVVASAGLMLLSLVDPADGMWLSGIAATVALPLHAAAAIAAVRRGQRAAQIYLGGVLLFSVAALHGLFVIWGLRDPGPFPVAVAAAGYLALAVMSTLALAAEARARLEEVWNRYRTVADFTHDWEYWLGADGALKYVSPSCERVTGHPPEEFLRDPTLVRALVLPEDRGVWDAHACRRSQPGGLAPDEEQGDDALLFRVRRPDGSVRWIEHRCQRVVAADGGDLGVRGSNRDVTERQEAERRLAQNRSLLAQMARVATVGELTAVVAHEISQPLASILSRAQGGLRFLSREPPALERVRAALDGIVADDRRASAVIRRLREPLEGPAAAPTPLDLGEVARSVVEMLRAELDRVGVVVQWDLADGLPPVCGDRVQLQQVVLNLVANAIAALAEVEPERRVVTIRLGGTNETGVTLEVRDRGPGIAAEVKDSLFEPFVTTKARGLGVGLSISRTIVEAHNGHLETWSAPGEGTLFTVALPAAEQEKEA